MTDLNSETNVSSSWRTGRRIVELGHLADQLRGCTDCGQPLQLDRIEKEVRFGLGSMLYVQCLCGVSNMVTTNKTHHTKPVARGMPAFDVNTKAALGMYHSGLGHRNINNFLSTLEIRGLHHSTFKARECEIRQHIHNVAQASCVSALTEEAMASSPRDTIADTCPTPDGDLTPHHVQPQHRELTSPSTDLDINSPASYTNPNPSITPTPCRKTMSANAASTADITPVRPQGCFKYDMGWQKRGSGRAYDSKSGVGTIIGNSTGKICAYGVRVSDCRMCSVYENKGQQPPTHDCHKNWAGSAKAMEPDVASELVKNIEETGIDVSVLIMDDDATTISRIRKESSHHITKWSDINHTSKQLTNSLYSLQKKHKELTNPVII